MTDNDMPKPYRGLTKYLEMSHTERLAHKSPKGKGYNFSTMNKRTRRAAKEAVDYLVLFSQNQKEEQVSQVLHGENVGALVKALIGEGSEEITPRHYELAKHFFHISLKRRLLELVEAPYLPALKAPIENMIATFSQLPLKQGLNPKYAEQRRETGEQLRQAEALAT